MGLCLAQFRCAQQQSHRTEACSFYLVVFALFPRCATFYHCFTAAFLQRALSPTWSVRPHTRAAHLPDIWGRKRDVADVLILLLILSWFVLTFNFLQVYCLSWGLLLSLWADVGIWQKELSRLDFDFAPIPSLALVLRNINRDCGVSPIWDEICFKLEKGIHKTWIYPIYWVNFHWYWRCTTFGIITVVLNLTIWGNTCFKLSKEGFLKR